MDDYSALAQRIAVNVSGVRGSLILSRDGLVLGAYPEGDESLAKPAWLKFVTLGEPEKSFVEFADQVWAFVKRGPYAAFSVAEAGTRPGILVDQMEQVLLMAEDGRTSDTVRLPDAAAAAPSGKPRTSLHPPAGKPQPSEVVAAAPSGRRRRPSHRSAPGERQSLEAAASRCPRNGPPPRRPQPPRTSARVRARQKEPKKLVVLGLRREEDESEVDRVLLAKEFSGLLQVDKGDDEASS